MNEKPEWMDNLAWEMMQKMREEGYTVNISRDRESIWTVTLMRNGILYHRIDHQILDAAFNVLESELKKDSRVIPKISFGPIST